MTVMLKEYLTAVRKPGQGVNPLFKLLGVEVEEITPEAAKLRLPFKSGLLQGGGVIAGGVMAALADEAMAHVVLANLPDNKTTATIELNLRFHKPCRGGELRARATVVKKGRQVIAVEAKIEDGKGALLATAGASFMIVDL
jgi:uncharacterized protein (TIGR00369 family)